MTRDRTRLILASIVALAAAGSGASGCAACPGSEVESEATLDVEASTACDRVATMRRASNFSGTLPIDECHSLCDDEDVTTCSFDFNYTNAFDTANPQLAGSESASVTCPGQFTTVGLTCLVMEDTIRWEFGGCPIEGRRPAHLQEPALAGEGGPVAAHLARSAHLEAASILAFQTLAEDLRDLGAPKALIADAIEAEADEVRHTAAMTRLARGYGAEPPPAIAPPREPRSAIAIALENAIEGVVREAFGAAVALYQAERAQDPAVRAAFAAIAVDECAHASLAIRVDSFVDALLTDAERALVAAAKRAAIDDLIASLAEPPVDVAARLGLPSAAASRRILAGMQADLWALALAA